MYMTSFILSKNNFLITRLRGVLMRDNQITCEINSATDLLLLEIKNRVERAFRSLGEGSGIDLTNLDIEELKIYKKSLSMLIQTNSDTVGILIFTGYLINKIDYVLKSLEK